MTITIDFEAATPVVVKQPAEPKEPCGTYVASDASGVRIAYGRWKTRNGAAYCLTYTPIPGSVRRRADADREDVIAAVNAALAARG